MAVVLVTGIAVLLGLVVVLAAVARLTRPLRQSRQAADVAWQAEQRIHDLTHQAVAQMRETVRGDRRRTDRPGGDGW